MEAGENTLERPSQESAVSPVTRTRLPTLVPAVPSACSAFPCCVSSGRPRADPSSVSWCEYVHKKAFAIQQHAFSS